MSAQSVCALRSSTPHPKLGFNVEGIRRRLIETHGPQNTPPVSRGLYDGAPDAWAHHDLCLVREVAQSGHLDASQTSDDEDGAGSTDPWQNARKQMGVVTTLAAVWLAPRLNHTHRIPFSPQSFLLPRGGATRERCEHHDVADLAWRILATLYGD